MKERSGATPIDIKRIEFGKVIMFIEAMTRLILWSIYSPEEKDLSGDIYTYHRETLSLN